MDSVPQPSDAGAAAPPARPTTPQVLLGLLIIWQIVFLLGDNVLNLLYASGRVTGKDKVGAVVDQVSGGIGQGKGHWHDIYYILQRWEYVCNTPQNWRMFSPGVADWFSFVRVELRWDDRKPGAAAPQGVRKPVELMGMNEPHDLANYVRMGPWRFQRYEDYFIAMDFRVYEEETPEKAQRRWKNQISERIDSEWPTMNAYLNFRWRKYKREHPDIDEDPKQLILLVYSYGIPERPGKPLGPTVMPIVRWQPGGKAEPGTWAALQAWSPQSKQWINK